MGGGVSGSLPVRLPSGVRRDWFLVSTERRSYRVNDDIRAGTVRVVRDNEQLGIMSIADALELALSQGLDLVEIAPAADPPVARIIDEGRRRYEQQKRDRHSRRVSRAAAMREVRMRVRIGEHDLDLKMRTARKLLAEGSRVRIVVTLRGREVSHPEVARDLLDRAFTRIADAAHILAQPHHVGRTIVMDVAPE